MKKLKQAGVKKTSVTGLILDGAIPRTVLALALGTFSAHAGFSLGDADNYAVLYEGNGSHNLQINSNPVGGSTISGNVGLGDELGGNPTAQFNNPAVINGNINFASASANTSNLGDAIINGTVNKGVTQVETDMDYINSLSQNLAYGSGTTIQGSSIAINTSATGAQTINANGGMKITSGINAGTYVYNVSSMNFGNHTTLTINGSASDYVALNFDFSTHFSGTIVLTGGITSDQVIFNIVGGSDATLTGGDTLQSAANNATQTGTFIDANGTINLNSVNIAGRVFGGGNGDMQIVSGCDIGAPLVPPSVPEPATVFAGALLLLPFGICTFRNLRRNRRA